MPTLFWICCMALSCLVLGWLFCVIKLPSGKRKGLLPVGLVMYALAAVLFGGDWLLAQLGLTWRIVPRIVLSLLLWGFGLAVGILTVWNIGKVFESRRKSARTKAVAGLCLFAVMCFGTLFGGAWACLNPTETVGDYHGVTVVQGKTSWLDVYYELYEYHGLLVRGKHRIVADYKPFLREEP